MAGSLLAAGRRRYVVPGVAVAMTAALVTVPQLAKGDSSPVLPARTAAQLLAMVEQTHVPDFSGTVVETTRLGLPNLSDAGLAGIAAPDSGLIGEIMSLLAGSHTAQIAYAGPDRQRVALFLDDLTETDIVHNGRNVWTYSSADNSVSHTVHELAAPNSQKGAGWPGSSTLPPIARVVDPQQAAEQALAAIDPSTAVSVDRTAHVADRSAYQLVLRPRTNDSLIGSIRIAIDARTALPLRVEVWPRASATSPAVQVAFTSLRLATPSASTFEFTKPPGAVVKSGPFALDPRMVTPHPVGGLVKRRLLRHQVGQVVQTRVPNGPGPAAAAPSPAAAGRPGFRIVGHDWLQVLVGQASATDASGSSQDGPSAIQQLTGNLDRVTTRVAGGRLLRTTLVSVLLTDDGRILVGAVAPSYLERLAAQGLGK
jgi:outer membrane lipoprotein-sorting protein